MMTPTHVVLNWVVLGRERREGVGVEVEGEVGGEVKRRGYVWPVFLGALLPDVGMFGFYFWQRWVLETRPRRIWNVEYFREEWQIFIDVFNSLPLMGVLMGVGLWRKNRFLCWVAASMMLHVAFDLPLHHDDGHGHFWPLTDWRFESPVSYWDPRHYGRWVSRMEMGVMVVGLGVLGRRWWNGRERVKNI